MRVAGIPLGVGNSVGADPSLTLALLHFDGANGSTTFTDSSPHSANRVISTYGSPTHSNISTQAGFGNRVLCEGGNAVVVSDNNTGDFDFGTSPFTVEGRFEIKTWGYENTILYGQVLWVYINHTNQKPTLDISFDGGTTRSTIEHQTTVNTDTKYHFAVVRTVDGYVDLYVHGVRATNRLNVGTSVTCNIPQEPASYVLGCTLSGYQALNGYIDEFRIRKEAMYSGASFTVPSAPFTG
jgi:hypothetical protein